ncbi:hypothetical protein J5226_16210 [Lysobacter sp. K5869]|uniref:hypothetical protein n=1 Tax=Lysobacter sp. K5869 TaxID=2820808 RepID=UPI001C061712|nr:hypothetical protein [Lysobacter sp. K5869]QWP75163.1 hypothetical protein J5226_16210 [Lysobacter sp. K5869]
MSRDMEIARLRARLERDHWPRLQMSLIVLLTGAAGFLASFGLLHAGVHSMALRYPLAACIAYAAFLLLLWSWARSHGHKKSDSDFDFDLPEFGGGSGRSSRSDWQGSGGHSGGGGASASYDAPSSPSLPRSGSGGGDWDIPSLDDADVFGWIVVAIIALAAAVLATVFALWSAPALMAEVLLDVTLAGGLYRRLRGIEAQHWLSTALRRTAVPFLLLALIAAALGFVGARSVPGADSIGDVIAAYRDAHG